MIESGGQPSELQIVESDSEAEYKDSDSLKANLITVATVNDSLKDWIVPDYYPVAEMPAVRR